MRLRANIFSHLLSSIILGMIGAEPRCFGAIVLNCAKHLHLQMIKVPGGWRNV
jgi:hypothetical protein